MSKGRRRHREAPGMGRDAAERTDASSAQAPDVIEPADVDGVRTVAVITVLWAVAFVVLALRIDDLSAEGRNWWLWTCLAGVGLGLLGLEYTRKRRDAIEAAAEARAEAADEDEETPAEPAAAEPVDVQPMAVQPVDAQPVEARPEHVRPVEAQPVVEPPPVERSSPEAITRPIDTGPLPSHRPESPRPEPTRPEPPAPEPESPPRQHGAPSAPAWFGDLDDKDAPGSNAASPAPPATPPSRPAPDLDDDEPLLDTTLGGGRRARRSDMTGEIDEVTEGGGEQYRGRRARRSDSA